MASSRPTRGREAAVDSAAEREQEEECIQVVYADVAGICPPFSRPRAKGAKSRGDRLMGRVRVELFRKSQDQGKHSALWKMS